MDNEPSSTAAENSASVQDQVAGHANARLSLEAEEGYAAANGHVDPFAQQPSTSRRAHIDSKDDVLKVLGRCLVLPVGPDGKYRTPVVTLHTSDTANLYSSLIERQLRQEYLLGAEKWWKIIRTDQNLDTWRPRVHGTQLKALLNCRLPEHPEEFAKVESVVSSIKFALRHDTSPEKFVMELRKFIQAVEVWWDNRNSRRPTTTEHMMAGALKRPASNSGALPPPSSKHQATGGTPKKPSVGMAPPQGQVPSFAPQLMRFPAGYSDSGAKRESPDDMMQGNGPNDMAMGPSRSGPASFAPFPPLPNPQELSSIVPLNVGGTPYHTMMATLLSVPNSFFWDLLGPDRPPPPRTPYGEVFIDRDGKLFKYILEHLRAMSNNEPYSPLPEDANELAALAREAEFYMLPGLLERIQGTAIMPQASTRAQYDSIYLETGFNSIEGPSLKEMEQRKVVVMQQMNHVLAQKALDGFFVAACECGVNHREGPDGMQHNLFYHILLKRQYIQVPHRLSMQQLPPPGALQLGNPQQMGMPMQLPGGGQLPPLPLPIPMPGQGRPQHLPGHM